MKNIDVYIVFSYYPWPHTLTYMHILYVHLGHCVTSEETKILSLQLCYELINQCMNTMRGKNRASIKKYDWFNAIIGRFNLDDIAELSYFMAFSLPMNRAQRRKARLYTEAEGPSMIFISQPGEHIHCGLDKY